MRLLGFKLSRYRQWFHVLKSEGRHLSCEDWADMAMLGVELVFRPQRQLWFRRMRSCGRCPIYLRETHQCKREHEGQILGCRCYMPVKTLTGPCWAREQMPEGDIGWPDELLAEKRLTPSAVRQRVLSAAKLLCGCLASLGWVVGRLRRFYLLMLQHHRQRRERRG